MLYVSVSPEHETNSYFCFVSTQDDSLKRVSMTSLAEGEYAISSDLAY